MLSPFLHIHSSFLRGLEFYSRAVHDTTRSSLGAIVPVAMFGRLFGCPNWWGVTGIQWAKARDAARHLTMSKTLP